MAANPQRSAPVVPRPFFTLAILYLFLLFFLFAFLLVAPALWEVAQTVPPGPQQEQAAYEAARLASQGRILPALLMAIATLVVGVKYRLLPGLR